MANGREQFKKHMQKHELSQADVARELNVSESMVSNWLTEDEAKRRSPSLENAHAIEEKFGIPAKSWIEKRKPRGSAGKAA